MTNDSLRTIKNMLSRELRALAIRKHIHQNITMLFKEVQYMMSGFDLKIGTNLELSTAPIGKNISQHYGYTGYLIKLNLLIHLDPPMTIDDVKEQEG